jgi:dUTPase
MKQPIFHKIKAYGLQPLKTSYRNDAGRDLLTPKEVVVPPFGYAKIPLGISVELPKPEDEDLIPMMQLVTRSSTVEKLGVMAVTGIVDYGYEGELQTVVVNFTPEEKVIPALARTHQAVLYWVGKQESYDKERNAKGFGSSS